jgi:hypothetical protein
MKTANKIVYAYILGCIDLEGSDAEKLEYLRERFVSEYCHANNLKYYGSYQKCLAGWIAGRPSCFNVDFENYRILELAREWGSIPANASERMEDKILGNWFNFIAAKTLQLFRKNQIGI